MLRRGGKRNRMDEDDPVPEHDNPMMSPPVAPQQTPVTPAEQNLIFNESDMSGDDDEEETGSTEPRENVSSPNINNDATDSEAITTTTPSVPNKKTKTFNDFKREEEEKLRRIQMDQNSKTMDDFVKKPKPKVGVMNENSIGKYLPRPVQNFVAQMFGGRFKKYQYHIVLGICAIVVSCLLAILYWYGESGGSNNLNSGGSVKPPDRVIWKKLQQALLQDFKQLNKRYTSQNT
jgi:hypothetical protein